MFRQFTGVFVLFSILCLGGSTWAAQEEKQNLTSLAQACAREELDIEVRLKDLRKLERDAYNLNIKLNQSHGKLSKDCRVLKVEIQKQVFLEFVLDLTSFALSLTSGPFTESLAAMGLKAVQSELFILGQGLEEAGKYFSKQEIGHAQAEREAKEIIADLESKLEQLDSVRSRIHQRRKAMLQEIKDLEARLKELKRNCAEDAARLAAGADDPGTSPDRQRPVKGGYWQMVEVSGGPMPPREEECYTRSGSGGEGSMTFTVLNKCTKGKTKFQGVATWSRPPEILVPGRKYQQEIKVRRLAYDPGLFQDVHLAVNLEPARISCGVTAGGKEFYVFMKVGSKSKSSGDTKTFRFVAPDLGYADSLSTRKIALLFCSSGGGYKYVYRWVPENGKPESVKLPPFKKNGEQGSSQEEERPPESADDKIPDLRLSGRWDDPGAQGSWTFKPLQDGSYWAEFKGQIRARGKARLEGRNLSIDLKVGEEVIRYQLTLSQDGARARGSWTSSNGETQKVVLSRQGDLLQDPESQAPTDRIRPGEKPGKLFDNGNSKGVRNNPTAPTRVSLPSPHLITRITTYHHNHSKGDEPGSIGLQDNQGRMYGPWKTLATNPDGTPPRRYWTVAPMVVLPPGKYTVVDSNPATWSQNSDSGGRGIVWVEGVPR